MKLNHHRALVFCLAVFILLFAFGCIPQQTVKNETKPVIVMAPAGKTMPHYENTGRDWGKRHRQMGLSPGGIDREFVSALIAKDNLNFFWSHGDLKEAFKKGYRFGYERRTADLVLGPHLTEAAAVLGNSTAQDFVATINQFEEKWVKILEDAIDVFIVLISEGSQADRENFIAKFTAKYEIKYSDSQEKLRAEDLMTLKSEGGTLLYIDSKETLAILDIPSPETLKSEIYFQAFRAMGDEWGNRFSHNLIKRDELIDLLRRSKTALQEIPVEIPADERLKMNMGRIYNAFVSIYGTDAQHVFQSIIKEAGYDLTMSVQQPTLKGKSLDAKKRIIIRSNVKGDRVNVNGKYYGQTPFSLSVAQDIKYEVVVEKTGYTPKKRVIDFDKYDDGESVYFELERQ